MMILEPVNGDLSMFLLEKFFGNVAVGGNDIAPWMYALQMFNNLALIAVGALLTYTLVVGTMNTAHQGEALGKGYNTMWTPLKSLFAVALVLPITAGGFTVAQTAIFKVAVMGIGLADSVYANTALHFTMPKLSMQNRVSYTFTKDILKAVTCLEIAKKGKYFGENMALYKTQIKQYNDGSDRLQILWGRGGKCGEIYLTTNKKNNVGWLAKTFETESNSAYEIQNSVNKTTQRAAMQLISDLRKPANILINNLYNNGVKLTFQDVEKARLAFDKSINSAATAEYMRIFKGGNLYYEVKKGGWLTAGSMYNKIGRYVAEVDNFAIQPYSRIFQKDKNMTSMLSDAKYRWAMNAINQLYIKAAQDGAGEIKSHLEWNDGALLAKKIAMLAGEDTDAMLTIRHIGNFATNTAVSIKAGSFIFKGAAMGLDKIADLNSIAMVLTVIGFAFSTALPMLPYAFFLFGVTAWLMLIGTVLVSAPIWAAWLALGKGDDTLHGGSEKGFAVLFEIFIKPSLMVIGLFMAMALVNVMGQFMLQTVFDAIGNNQEGGFNALSTIYALIFSGILLAMLLYTTLSLIAELATKVLEMIGVSEHNEGKQSTNINTIGGNISGAGAHISSAGREGKGDGGGKKQSKQTGGEKSKNQDAMEQKIRVSVPKAKK